MRFRSVVLVALMVLMLPAVPTAQRAAATTPAVAAREDLAHAVVALTNRERARTKRPAVIANAQLMRAAQLHAEQMARSGRLGHQLRGVKHPRPEDRLRASGYHWQAWAENIASGQQTASEVLESWMKSKGHRDNILAPLLTEIGVGCATDRSGQTYWVQVFGRPIPDTR